MSAHYFTFSRDFVDGRRLCGDCRLNYDAGEHIEITVLEPYTSYVCPENRGQLGHSGRWTGAYLPELRRLSDGQCICGATLVKEDQETWRLSWEMQHPPGTPWHTVSKVQSRHGAETQRAGLLELIEQGEPIRNVQLTQLREVSA